MPRQAALLYQAYVKPPEQPPAAPFDPSNGFPWPQPFEVPKPKQRNVATDGFITRGIPQEQFLGQPYISWSPLFADFARRIPPKVHEQYARGFPPTQLIDSTWRPTFTDRVPGWAPQPPVGFYALGNEATVPVVTTPYEWFTQRPDQVWKARQPQPGFYVRGVPQDQFLGQPYLSWSPLFTDFARRLPPKVHEFYVRGTPQDQLLGDPYLSWFNQHPDRVPPARRQHPAVGYYVRGEPAELLLGQPYLAWLNQRPDQAWGRLQHPPVGYYVRGVPQEQFLGSPYIAWVPTFPSKVDRAKPQVWFYWVLGIDSTLFVNLVTPGPTRIGGMPDQLPSRDIPIRPDLF